MNNLEVRFKTNKLQKQYENSKEAIKEYGVDVAKKYINRVTLLKSAKSFDDWSKIPQLRFHPLTGNRKGEFAISLQDFTD